MQKIKLALIAAVAMPLGALVLTQGEKQLTAYYLDMEGGGGTLFVSPSGESMLIDAGNPGARDAGRIVAAATAAGLKQIDYLVVTHYHGDHYGGVPDVAAQIPIRNFVDIGPSLVPTDPSSPAYKAYSAARDKGRHIPVKPGDKLPIKGLDVTIVSAGGQTLEQPLAGAGTANPLCGEFTPREKEQLGDQVSVGVHIRYGNFRALQLGDLTWNKEQELFCPANVIGTVDVYQTSAHGLTLSSPRLIVHALRPRVVMINNGSRKGATRETLSTVKSSPGLEDVWLVHFSEERPGNKAMMEPGDQGGKAFNPPEQFIANVEDHKDDPTTRATRIPGHPLRLVAREDGSFVVTNPRTGFNKVYSPSKPSR